MDTTKATVLDCFTIRDSYSVEVLARVESKARYVRFGTVVGLRAGRYIVYWTDAPSCRPIGWPQFWFKTLREAREHFESERDYELYHRR